MNTHEYTLEMFMNDYKGFDWNKSVVLINKNNCKPYILSCMWEDLINTYKKYQVYDWYHDENVMVIVTEET